MREGWEIKTIGDVCDILDRKRKPISKRDREPGPYPYYGASCIQDYISDYLFDGRFLLIGEDGAKWGPGEDTAYIAEGKFWVNNHAHIVKAKAGYLDDYLRYYIKHLDLNPIVAGAIIPKLTQEKLASLEVPIPSLPEQQRIVDILDREFAKIDALKANTEKSLQAAKDLFQATLKKELEPKEGWVIKPFGEICDIFDKRRKPISKRDREPGPYPYYGASCIQDYVKDYLFDGRYLLIGEDGAKWGPGDDTAYIVEGKFWVNNHAHIVKARDGFLDDYLRYYIKQLDLNPLVAGAIIPKLTQEKLVALEIPVPSFELQQEIVSKLDNLNDRCNTLQENYQKILTLCDDLKQSLLRKAFNGEL